MTKTQTTWKFERINDRRRSPIPDATDISPGGPNSGHGLFVIPRGRGNGFRANIRGNILELGDPDANGAFAATPDDLFVAAIVSGFAWSARKILRASGLPDDVSVSATWQRLSDRAGIAELHLTVVVSRGAEAVRAALAVAMDESLAAQSLSESVVRISVEGVN